MAEPVNGNEPVGCWVSPALWAAAWPPVVTGTAPDVEVEVVGAAVVVVPP